MEPDLRLEHASTATAPSPRRSRACTATRAPISCGARCSAAGRCSRRAPPRRRPPPAPRATSSILNFALTLEELQAAFYTEVERNHVLHGELKRQADTVGGPRARPRAGLPRRPGLQGDQAAALRLRRRDRGLRCVPAHGGRLRGPGGRRLQGPGAAHHARARTSPRRWPSTRSRRATPRGSGGWRASRRSPARSTSRVSRAAATRIVARTHFVMRRTSRKGPKFTG